MRGLSHAGRVRHGRVMKILLSEAAIQARIRELANHIGQDYRDRPLTIVGVLTGSLIFLADLTRRLPIPHRLGVLQASSYRGESVVPGELRINTELVPDLEGRHVLLLDDILDTGQTLAKLVHEVRHLRPLSVRTVVLLRKQGRQLEPFEPDYCGFEIPDVFVVGYGLDFNDDFRHLPDLSGLEESDITAAHSG